MKKIFLTFGILLVVLTTTQAQDTLNYLRHGYYTWSIDTIKANSLTYLPYRAYGLHGGLLAQAVPLGAGDTLNVVGLAAIMASDLDLMGGEWPVRTSDTIIRPGDDAEFDTIIITTPAGGYQYDDSSYNDCYEYLGIYRPSADTVSLVKNLIVHRGLDTPVQYYTPRGLYRHGPREDADLHYVYGVYEEFFDTAMTMTETFFLGLTMRTFELHDSVPPYSKKHRKRIQFTTFEYFAPQLCSHVKTMGRCRDIIYWADYAGSASFCCMFPILSSSNPGTVDDTVPVVIPGGTVAPGDTTTAAVRNADLLRRYVSVSPNPAADRAEVLSSFGLSEIEVYDEQGRLQQTLKASGLKATLATAAWPRGTYYLRIHTPLGPATKKLIVM